MAEIVWLQIIKVLPDNSPYANECATSVNECATSVNECTTSVNKCAPSVNECATMSSVNNMTKAA